jgi:hypothetical protein
MSPRVFPGWVLENFKLVAAGKPSGHSNLGLDRSSEVPLRAAGWRAQKQRVVPNFCETRPSIRYVNYAYGNLDTTVPRCLFGSGPAVALMGGVLGRRTRSKRFAPPFRWSFSKIMPALLFFVAEISCPECGEGSGRRSREMPARKRAPLRQNSRLDQSDRRNKMRFFLSRCDRFSKLSIT